MDILHIEGLNVATRIGVHAWEQRISQRLLLDITIPTNCSNCEDQLANTIDYDKVCQLATAFIESNSFQLIETVAEKVAQLIKKEFNINQITLSVSKPHAIKNAVMVKVTITR